MPYLAIIVLFVWQLPQSSGVLSRQCCSRGPAMSCDRWQSVHTGTSGFPPSISASPCTLFA